jgi:hypothetical protein
LTEKSSSFLGGLRNQTLHSGRSLGTDTLPIGQAVLCNAQTFFMRSSDGVVKTNALNEAAVTAGALVSDNDIEKGASLGSTASESNDDHDLSFGGVTIHTISSEFETRNLPTREVTLRKAVDYNSAFPK